MKKLFYLLPLMLAFACQPDQSPPEALQSVFEEVNVVKMHIFATKEKNPDAEMYPYTGKPFDGNILKFLPDGIQPDKADGVFACYRTEYNGFYILRVPGQEVSSDLILCKWDMAAGKLKKVMDLASIACQENGCSQQDAWLADLDDDRMLELIIRSVITNAEGNATQEEFNVLSQDAGGNFVKSNEQITSLAVKANYVLYQEMK